MRFAILTLLFGVMVSCSSVPQGTVKVIEPVSSSNPVTKVPHVSVNGADEQLVFSNLGPMESIKDLDRQVESYHLGQNLSEEQLAQNTHLKKNIIRGTFDIEELSRLALDKHWAEIKADMQKHFVSLMKELLEKKAIFSKEQLKGENKYYRIEYIREEPDKSDHTRATVYTKMLIPKRGMDLDLTYKLVKKEYGWKIFDVIVDDASLLSNYRFQFDRIIQKSGFDDLIKRMENRLASIH